MAVPLTIDGIVRSRHVGDGHPLPPGRFHERLALTACEALAGMAALDTNVLVRLLVRDDPAQLASAQRLIQQRAAAGETLFVSVTVALELE